MSPPGLTATTEPPGEHITGVRTTDLTTKSGQERYLVHELGVTYPQAKALIRAYELDQRDARHRDAERFVREEFGPWLRRRGDLMVVRGKAKREWAVTSG
ncbi:hypothetical protein L2K70_04905 [Nocardioides KLBMP 9356]|uniref:DUF3263 domain-containing protein n=1 Tax=Nocardioides potassii TaxID=2911371 RepID=A0ABS9H6S6_9ACTN|nr:hypothetical protein [Nocardioides potassii]MCF6376935.1 hypothetical protein [Nocardioides potassii]